jgi:ATP-dependent RNA helicase RhlE
VLVATDAARGIDIDQLPVVINFDLPNIPEPTCTELVNWTCWKWWYCNLFVVKMNIPTGKTFKTYYKVDVKTVSDHQYHWHSGSPELPAGSQKKIQTEAEEHTNQENRSF